MIKYSIVFPYIFRSGQLYNTLMSFAHHYHDRNDYEVVIVEDVKNKENEEEHNLLLEVIDTFKNDIKIKLIESNFKGINPAPLFNLGVKHSEGEYIVITNPEGFHYVNILKGLDSYFSKMDCYVVCSCLNVTGYEMFAPEFTGFKFEPHSWYQHSKNRNAMFHFCSSLSKENYLKIGGFDERFANGYCYDDDDFRETVKRNNIPFVVDDLLLTFHQAHETVGKDIKDLDKKLKRNKALYCLKLQGTSNEEIEEFLDNL